MKPVEVIAEPPPRWPIPGGRYSTKDRRFSMEVLATETTFLIGNGVKCQWNHPPGLVFHIGLDELARRFDAMDNVVPFSRAMLSAYTEETGG